MNTSETWQKMFWPWVENLRQCCAKVVIYSSSGCFWTKTLVIFCEVFVTNFFSFRALFIWKLEENFLAGLSKLHFDVERRFLRKDKYFCEKNSFLYKCFVTLVGKISDIWWTVSAMSPKQKCSCPEGLLDEGLFFWKTWMFVWWRSADLSKLNPIFPQDFFEQLQFFLKETTFLLMTFGLWWDIPGGWAGFFSRVVENALFFQQDFHREKSCTRRKRLFFWKL